MHLLLALVSTLLLLVCSAVAERPLSHKAIPAVPPSDDRIAMAVQDNYTIQYCPDGNVCYDSRCVLLNLGIPDTPPVHACCLADYLSTCGDHCIAEGMKCCFPPHPLFAFDCSKVCLLKTERKCNSTCMPITTQCCGGKVPCANEDDKCCGEHCMSRNNSCCNRATGQSCSKLTHVCRKKGGCVPIKKRKSKKRRSG